ncbi:cytochrome oxidase putative small subunit CydP [Undibacterium sp. TJN25]|uniref:cytochrome oxidase putative small subunit CydP n=1 Tax=Undibacterium sp. TJN25 TaxID=3413056 RepID=UPI003BF39494
MPMQLEEFSPPPASPRWWPRRFTRLPLALEITLALIVKAVILTMLWKFFFSHPQAKKMRLPLPQVEQHLLAQNPSTMPTVPRVSPAATDAPSPVSKTTDKGFLP